MSDQSSSDSDTNTTASFRSAVTEKSVYFSNHSNPESGQNSQSDPESVHSEASQHSEASHASTEYLLPSITEPVYANSSPESTASGPVAQSTPYSGAITSRGPHLRSDPSELEHTQGVQPATRQRRRVPVPLSLRTYGLGQARNLNEFTFNVPTGDDTLVNVSSAEVPSFSGERTEEPTYVNTEKLSIDLPVSQHSCRTYDVTRNEVNQTFGAVQYSSSSTSDEDRFAGVPRINSVFFNANPPYLRFSDTDSENEMAQDGQQHLINLGGVLGLQPQPGQPGQLEGGQPGPPGGAAAPVIVQGPPADGANQNLNPGQQQQQQLLQQQQQMLQQQQQQQQLLQQIQQHQQNPPLLPQLNPGNPFAQGGN